MNQSSVIGASIILAYVIFVIAKGELPCYLQVLGIATAAQCPNPPPGCAISTTTSSSPATTVSPVLNFGGGGSPIGIGVTLPGGIGIGLPGVGIGI